jgi:D-ribose pyranose/furanose isomerase RbsD
MRICFLACFFIINVSAMANWEKQLSEQLPLMGHRNWVVIADSAYPLQTAAGIKTLYAGQDHLKVVQKVLEKIVKQKHVRPVIFVDKELDYVAEKDAPGITELRQKLEALLENKGAETLPHEDIISQLDKAGKTFGIIVIKTDLTLPYTSVFIRLDCGYWGAEAEQRLRDAMSSD